MALEHVDALAIMQAQVMPNPWSAAQFSGSLEAGHISWVVGAGEALAGVIVFSLVVDELELLTLAVNKSHQRQGLARTLLHCGLRGLEVASAARCTLEVMQGNEPAIKLYQSAGFTEVGRRKHYYRLDSGPVDALVMQRTQT